MENTNLPPKKNDKSKKQATIPRADIDLADVLKKVSRKWTESPWLTLQYTTSVVFAQQAASFGTTLESKNDKASKRPQYTVALELLDKKIDSNLSYVKNAIAKKYTKESAKSYYSAFGIETRNRIYELPRDQNKRAAALKQLLRGLNENSLGNDQHGTALWTGILTEYETQLELANETDGAVSKKVGDKNLLKLQNKKVLNSLIQVIKGNYPDTYAEELRDWGFQKEKY